MSTGAASERLVTVRLIGLPLPLHREASEHSDGLQREFALIERSTADESGLPTRLRRLITELGIGFRAFTAQPTEELRQARERGDDRIDLTYHMPARAREAVLQLGQLLDEADEFCRAGEHLLTLATPPGPLAFRRWFLGEFVAQIDGAQPTPWEKAGTGAGG